MDHERFKNMLADYLGDELSPEDRRSFEEHLARSDADRAEVESLRAVLNSLRQLPPPPMLYSGGPASAPQSVRPTHTRLVRYVVRPLSYAAILLIGIGVGWFAKPTSTTTPVQHEPTTTVVLGSHRTRAPSLFIRNVAALSSAFTQPTETRTPQGRRNG